MSNSIYSLTKTEQGVQLLIQPSATTRAERLGFVIAGVGAAGVLTVLMFGIGVLTVIVTLFSFSIAAIFLWGVCAELALRRIFFLPDKMILTSSISAFRKTRVVPLRSIDHFGFGNFGHQGTPVLKFTVADKWTVLAFNVAELDAKRLVDLLRSEGVNLPNSQ